MKYANKGPAHLPKWLAKQDPMLHALPSAKKRL
jgi:hypothetical protein